MGWVCGGPALVDQMKLVIAGTVGRVISLSGSLLMSSSRVSVLSSS